MIFVKSLPLLYHLNNFVRLGFAPQKMNARYLWSSSNYENLRFSHLKIRNMSSNIEDTIQDPKRHFDFVQLIQKKKDGNVILIDVREHSEINETGKLPDSIHIPLNDLEGALAGLTPDKFLKKYKTIKPDYQSEIIFTCRSGRRSLTALAIALKYGYQNKLSEEDFKKKYNAAKPSKNAFIIFSCKAGGRSLKALRTATELGYDSAGNYKGGWLDWKENSDKGKC